MSTRNLSTGFSLLELMIVVALIGVLSAIALPLYNGYIQTSREGALVTSISTITVFQEDLRMRTGAYAAGTWDAANAVTSLFDNVGWSPRSSDDTVYVATLVATTGYRVTATDSSGVVVCLEFPDKTNC